MVDNPADIMKRLVVVLSKVKKQLLHEKSDVATEVGGFTDLESTLKRELGELNMCEVNLTEFRRLKDKSPMEYVQDRNLTETHNVAQFKKVVDHAFSHSKVQMRWPKTVIMSRKDGTGSVNTRCL